MGELAEALKANRNYGTSYPGVPLGGAERFAYGNPSAPGNGKKRCKEDSRKLPMVWGWCFAAGSAGLFCAPNGKRRSVCNLVNGSVSGGVDPRPARVALSTPDWISSRSPRWTTATKSADSTFMHLHSGGRGYTTCRRTGGSGETAKRALRLTQCAGLSCKIRGRL